MLSSRCIQFAGSACCVSLCTHRLALSRACRYIGLLANGSFTVLYSQALASHSLILLKFSARVNWRLLLLVPHRPRVIPILTKKWSFRTDKVLISEWLATGGRGGLSGNSIRRSGQERCSEAHCSALSSSRGTLPRGTRAESPNQRSHLWRTRSSGPMSTRILAGKTGTQSTHDRIQLSVHGVECPTRNGRVNPNRRAAGSPF